tara:strand:+ start:28 stop:471 length:444 start_codon:yes stop_codon:yes gene_type:complete
MKDQEIVDSAPDWADTHRKLLDYPDCTTYADNTRDGKLDRSLADIKELVELRNEKAELVSRIAKAELAFAIVEGRNAEIEKEREWIDVTKELPKITMSVLVTDGLKVGELTYVKYVNGTGKWAGNNEHITGWMLKPKSPRALKDLKS